MVECRSTTSEMSTETRRVFVGNLPFVLTDGTPISENALKELFSEFGHITDAIIVRDRETRRPKYAFIEFMTNDEADNARMLNRCEFHGRGLIVDFANPRRSVEREIRRSHNG